MNRTSTLLRVDFRFFASPLGWLLLAAGDEGLCLVHFCGTDKPSRKSCQVLLENACGCPHASFSPDQPLLREAEEAVEAYLHQRRPIPPFPLEVRAGTTFQRQVWDILCRIPFGETRSYLQVAKLADRARASRAVGQACGRNPLPLFIPCHRVIATDGGLAGFSGGLHLKKTLLALEQGNRAPEKSPEKERFVADSGG